jgi:hypothetical protein
MQILRNIAPCQLLASTSASPLTIRMTILAVAIKHQSDSNCRNGAQSL